MTTHRIFRQEVLDARRQHWIGGISLVQPLRWWVATSVAIALAVAVLCLLFAGSYTRRSTVSGQLIPDRGLASVVAPSAGVVARLLPEEGSEVEAGDPLALIQVPRATADGNDARAASRGGLEERLDHTRALARSQLQQIDAQIQGATRQLQAAHEELRQIEAEIATRREQEVIARETVSRHQSVADQRFISAVQLSQQRQLALDATNARQALERQATQVRRTMVQLEQSLHELPAQRLGLVAGSRRELATLEEESVQDAFDEEQLLRAPVAGLIANRLVEPGQSVQSGQQLLRLLPRGSHLQAELEVPSRAIGFVELGDRVQLRYQAYPYQKFGHHGGRVLRISRSAISDEHGTTPAEPYYRVLVELDRQDIPAFGSSEPLRPGLVLDADILGERRRLYEWVLEPLYALNGRLGGE